MQENKEKPSWGEITESLASEIIESSKRESKAKDIGIVCVSVLTGGIIAGMMMLNHSQTQIMHENDNQWRKTVETNNQSWIDYLSQYDFISQDGEGINNINTGEQGDLINGPESENSKEPEQGPGSGSEAKEEKEAVREVQQTDEK